MDPRCREALLRRRPAHARGRPHGCSPPRAAGEQGACRRSRVRLRAQPRRGPDRQRDARAAHRGRWRRADDRSVLRPCPAVRAGRRRHLRLRTVRAAEPRRAGRQLRRRHPAVRRSGLLQRLLRADLQREQALRRGGRGDRGGGEGGGSAPRAFPRVPRGVRRRRRPAAAARLSVPVLLLPPDLGRQRRGDHQRVPARLALTRGAEGRRVSDALSDIVAAMSTAPDLHRPAFMPDLLVAALARHADKPAVYLGDQVLTASEVAAEMSRYLQAYASLGIGEHHPIAMLAKNRPEVLFTMGANMLNPCRSTSLHPLGSVDDQAYVLEDAGVETLVYDPTAFDERAAELRDRVPGLKTLLALGPSG